MFLIFGVKRLKRRLATMLAVCGHCGRPAAQVIVRVSTWFSLFFIPVIPLGTKYFSTCTLCGQTMKIDKDQATQMVTAAQQVAADPHAPAVPYQASQPLPYQEAPPAPYQEGPPPLPESSPSPLEP
jgi:hypothetical protein